MSICLVLFFVARELIIKCCWCVSVENENHCDFVKLREMLIRTNMEDLRETTHYRHYELYRRHKLEDMGFSDSDTRRLVKHSYNKQTVIVLQYFLQYWGWVLKDLLRQKMRKSVLVKHPKL